MFEAYTPEDQRTKRCNHCGRTLPLTAFSKRTKAVDGRQGRCRECAKIGWNQYKTHGSYRPFRPHRPTPEGHKWCGGCKSHRPLEEFYRNSNSRDGRSVRCIYCESDYSEKSRRWHKVAKQYGITKEDYMRMHDAQGGVCAICGGTNEGRMLYVDHNHTTGLVRGLLCRSCNQAIGYFQDDPDLVAKARQYLIDTDGKVAEAA